MTFRTATTSDLDAIMSLERASFGGDAWSNAVMEAELASPHNHYVVVEEAGRIVGYAGLRAPAGGNDADVQTIALADAVRGKGHGRALLRSLLREAAGRGMVQVFLDVREDNEPARRLYVSEGFVEIGRRAGYYPEGNADAIVMRLDVPAWAHASRAGSPLDAGACS